MSKKIQKRAIFKILFNNRMNRKLSKLLLSVFISVIINLVLPLLIKPLATQEQIKPTGGAHNLSFFGQIMHMLIHHGQVPLTSSVIVALIVAISGYLTGVIHL